MAVSRPEPGPLVNTATLCMPCSMAVLAQASAAIWAAMNPKSSDYYYYALGKDGLHHYSRTYNEHQAFLNSLPKE